MLDRAERRYPTAIVLDSGPLTESRRCSREHSIGRVFVTQPLG
jgi:hypothetical protein